MKQFDNAFQFIVNRRQVDKNKALKASNLYKKIAVFAYESIMQYNSMLKTHQTSYELNMFKNAFLKDELIVKSSVIMLDEDFFKLKIIVAKKDNTIICEAYFGYAIKKAS